jgi:hypothetical protein
LKEAEDAAQLLDAQRKRWRDEGQMYADDVHPFVTIISDFFADRWGERWRFTDKEILRIVQTTGTLIAKYMPEWMKLYREEELAARAWVTVFVPRIVEQVLVGSPEEKEVTAEEVTS